MYKLDKLEIEQLKRIAAWRASLDFDPKKGASLRGREIQWERWYKQQARYQLAPVTCNWRKRDVRHQVLTDTEPLDSYCEPTAADAERAAEVAGLMAHLPDDWRLALEGYLSGYSPTESGEWLGVHRNTIQSRVAAAIAELRRLVGNTTPSFVMADPSDGLCACGAEISGDNKTGACADCKYSSRHNGVPGQSKLPIHVHEVYQKLAQPSAKRKRPSNCKRKREAVRIAHAAQAAIEFATPAPAIGGAK